MTFQKSSGCWIRVPWGFPGGCALGDIERLPAKTQVDKGGLNGLDPEHLGIDGLEETNQGPASTSIPSLRLPLI